MNRTTKFLKDHSLGIILGTATIIAMVAFWYIGMAEWVPEQLAQGFSADIYPGYWTHYWSRVFENILSELWQVFILVMLTKKFYEKDSPESKDPDEEEQ